MPSEYTNFCPKKIVITDLPCGSGKTSKMIRTLKSDKLYLIVVPLLSEVKRVLDGTSHLDFEEPVKSTKEVGTKWAALLELILQRKSIVTTHQLYSDIGHLAAQGFLKNYNVIIDEVPGVIDVVKSLSRRSVDEFYINSGYLYVSQDGLCTVTSKWDSFFDVVSDTIDPSIKKYAQARNLFVCKQGTFITALSKVLFSGCASVEVLTYKSEGSYFLKYLDKMNLPYQLKIDDVLEADFKEKARKLLTFADTKALEEVNFSYSKQTKYSEQSKETKVVRSGLKNWRARHLKGVPLENVMVTCAEANWRDSKAFKSARLQLRGFAKTTGLGKVHWVSNQMRGTNDYSHCSHLVYLYDKHPMPPITQWLGCSTKEFSDAYGLTELIQWIWRSRIRNGQPITLYIPSPRMKRLLLDWLNS
jgi:hypothetical protein